MNENICVYIEQQVVNSHPSNVFLVIVDMYCRLHIDPINLWLILESIHLFNQPCLLWVPLIMFLMNRIIKTFTFPETSVSKIIGKSKIHEKVSKKSLRCRLTMTIQLYRHYFTTVLLLLLSFVFQNKQ